MIFINSWKVRTKQWGKVNFKIRLGKITFFDIYADFTKKQAGIILLNFGIKTNQETKAKSHAIHIQ